MSSAKKIFKKYWVILEDLYAKTIREAFPAHPYRILDKKIDPIRRQVIFCVKVKRITATLDLTAKEILSRPEYFTGFSSGALEEVTQQYLLDICQPMAYIEEYPIESGPNRVYKIMLSDEKRLIYGTASFFIEEAIEIVSRLNVREVIVLSTAYYKEKFTLPEKDFYAECKNRLEENNFVVVK